MIGTTPTHSLLQNFLLLLAEMTHHHFPYIDVLKFQIHSVDVVELKWWSLKSNISVTIIIGVATEYNHT